MPDTASEVPPRSPWPRVLIAFFILFVSALVAFVVFSTTVQVDLVAADYYEQELAYQQQIDSERRGQEAGDSVQLTHDPARRRLELVFGRQAEDRPSLSGTIGLYRPSDAAMDRTIRIELDEQGRQVIETAALAAGFWKVQVRWTVDGEDYYREKSVVLK